MKMNYSDLMNIKNRKEILDDYLDVLISKDNLEYYSNELKSIKLNLKEFYEEIGPIRPLVKLPRLSTN